MSKNFKKYNYGRFIWTMKYPANYDEIVKAKDEEIVKWWRFLPPAQNDPVKKTLLKHVVDEFNRRFKSTSKVA